MDYATLYERHLHTPNIHSPDKIYAYIAVRQYGDLYALIYADSEGTRLIDASEYRRNELITQAVKIDETIPTLRTLGIQLR
jgi:hypothetical protein